MAGEFGAVGGKAFGVRPGGADFRKVERFAALADVGLVPALGAELAGQMRATRRQVARDRPAGPGINVALVEDHRVGGDGEAGILGHALRRAISLGERVAPGREARLDRLDELLQRHLRQRRADLVLVEGVVARHQRAPLGRARRLAPPAGALALLVRDLLELAGIDVVDERGEAFHEALVGAEGEVGVAELVGEDLDRAVVEPDVEDGVGQARHRAPRAGAQRQEQRALGAVEAPAGHRFQPLDAVPDIGAQRLRQGSAAGLGVAPGAGRERKSGRHRQVERRHDGEVVAFLAERFRRVGRSFGDAPSEGEQALGHGSGHALASGAAHGACRCLNQSHDI